MHERLCSGADAGLQSLREDFHIVIEAPSVCHPDRVLAEGSRLEHHKGQLMCTGHILIVEQFDSIALTM